MDTLKLMNLLESEGWKNLRMNSQHMGFTFDIVGERRYTATKWHLLVKIVNQLDATNFDQLLSAYRGINEGSKSYLWGKCFLFCVITGSVAPNVLAAFIRQTDQEILQAVRVRGGGGNIFVADSRTKQVYGTVPSLPLDVAKYSKQLVSILYQVI